jgi:hypothetical protein
MTTRQIQALAEQIAELEKKFQVKNDQKIEDKIEELMMNLSFEEVLAIDNYISEKNLLNN